MTKQEKKFEKLLKCFTSKDEARPHLKNAIVIDKNLCATNGYLLLEIKEYSNQDGVLKDGVIYEAKETVEAYPNYTQVIPDYKNNGGKKINVNFNFIKKIKAKKETQVYFDANGVVSFSSNDNTIFSLDLHNLDFLNYIDGELNEVEIEYIDKVFPIKINVKIKYIPVDRVTIIVTPMRFK